MTLTRSSKSNSFLSYALHVLKWCYIFSDVLWQKLSKVMVERMMDKIPVVRVQAIAALQRLQEPSDPTDPILSQYLRLMNTDTNKYVKEKL
jgi:condensin complex subunit 3